MNKFCSNVRWCFSTLLKYKKEDTESVALAQLYKKIQEAKTLLDATSITDEKELQPVTSLLTHGIPYLLLAEIVLEESPPTIQWYIKSGSASKEQTFTILLRWLNNRGVNLEELLNIHPAEGLATEAPFNYLVHECLIECFMDIYLQFALTIDHIMQAVKLINPAFDDEALDIEDAFLIWLGEACTTFDDYMTEYTEGMNIAELTFTDLWRDLQDGIALAKVIILYKPDALSTSSIFLEGGLHERERIYNWQKVIECCREHLDVTAGFNAETIVLADSDEEAAFKLNLLIFLADLFCALMEAASAYKKQHQQQPTMRSTIEVMKSTQLKEIEYTSPKSSHELLPKNEKVYRNLFEEFDAVSNSKMAKKQPTPATPAKSVIIQEVPKPSPGVKSVLIAYENTEDSVLRDSIDEEDEVLVEDKKEEDLPAEDLKDEKGVVTAEKTEKTQPREESGDDDDDDEIVDEEPLVLTDEEETVVFKPIPKEFTWVSRYNSQSMVFDNMKSVQAPAQETQHVKPQQATTLSPAKFESSKKKVSVSESIVNLGASIEIGSPSAVQVRPESPKNLVQQVLERDEEISAPISPLPAHLAEQPVVQQLSPPPAEQQKATKVPTPPMYKSISLVENKPSMARPKTADVEKNVIRQSKRQINISQIMKECESQAAQLNSTGDKPNIKPFPIAKQSLAAFPHKHNTKLSSDDKSVEQQLQDQIKENQLLKMKLLEYERRISKERELLQHRLQQEKTIIEQEAIRKFSSSRGSQRKGEKSVQSSASSMRSVSTVDKEVETVSTDSSHHDIATNPAEVVEEAPSVASSNNTVSDTTSVKNGVIEIPAESVDIDKKKMKLQKIRQQKAEEDHKRKEIKKRVETPSTEETTKKGPVAAIHTRTNRQLVKNAMSHVCLAGKVNEKKLVQVFEELEKWKDVDQFVLLVRDDKSPAFEALYALQADHKSSTLLFGKGPKQLMPEQIKIFLRYDSGGKKFVPLPSKTFSVTTDAAVLAFEVKAKLSKPMSATKKK